MAGGRRAVEVKRLEVMDSDGRTSDFGLWDSNREIRYHSMDSKLLRQLRPLRSGLRSYIAHSAIKFSSSC